MMPEDKTNIEIKSNSLPRGITITEIIEQDKSISYINRFNYKYLSRESTKFYDKPQSKYHK